MNNLLKAHNIPKHVAFIMDGNRRWAKKKALPIIDGHKMGSTVIKKIVKKSLKLGIKYLTFYSFSTENWNRKPTEINDLHNLLKFYLDTEIDNFKKNKINFSFIGNLDKFSDSVKNKLYNFKDKTKNFTNLYFVLALGYGSRLEIINAVEKFCSCKTKKITENLFKKKLMTANIPDPDLVIRTSGEQRLSNFLLWQIAYSELYFTKTLWPDYNSSKFQLAINNYIKRKRRFGKDNEIIT